MLPLTLSPKMCCSPFASFSAARDFPVPDGPVENYKGLCRQRHGEIEGAHASDIGWRHSSTDRRARQI